MARPTCTECGKPLNVCLCRFVLQLEHTVPITIIQHPAETKHPKNSVALLSRSLAHCRVVVSERPDDLLGEIGALYPERSLALLYPETPDQPDPPPAPRQTEDIHLLVLDGTWRKTRRILYENPTTAALPRLQLRTPQSGRYHIRKASDPHQLSTLEACALAIAQLEPQFDAARLLKAFDDWQAHLLEQRG